MFTKNRRRVDSFVALAIVANGRSNATRFAGKRMRHVVERVEMKNLRILKYFGNGRTGACGTSFSSRRFSHYVRGWVPKIDINSSRKSAQFCILLSRESKRRSRASSTFASATSRFSQNFG